MEKITSCLKCVFIFINVLSMIISGYLIFQTVMNNFLIQMSLLGGPGVEWMWVTTIGILIISCLGVFAGFSEKLLPLKIFAGFMLVGLIIVLTFVVVWFVSRTKAKAGFQGASEDFVQEFMGNEELKRKLDIFQKIFECCGVRGAEDWGETIADSCECNNSSDCVPKPLGYSGPSMIYSEPCNEIFEYFDNNFKLLIGIYFGFSITTLFGLLFTLLMIRQVSRHDSAGGPSMVMKGY